MSWSSGLLLSIGSIVYIMRQDQEARRRYAELIESRNALSQLPSNLLNAQEEERRSISRELHDEVGQSLGALLVDVGRLKAAIPADDKVAQEQLAQIKATAENTVNAVRNIALLLRPSMLDDLGLIAAIEWQAREISRRSELEVEVEAPAGRQRLRRPCRKNIRSASIASPRKRSITRQSIPAEDAPGSSWSQAPAKSR